MRREYFLTHFMTLVLFWYWNQTNYIAKKILQPNIPHERSCKILNKFLEPNWFQQHSKKDKIQWTNGMCPRNAKFVQYLKISIIYHVTRVQKGNHVTNSVDAEKAFNRIQNALLIKNNKLGIEGTFSIWQSIFVKSISEIMSTAIPPCTYPSRLKSYLMLKNGILSLRSGTRQDVHHHHLYSSLRWNFYLVQSSKKKKEKTSKLPGKK